MDFVLGALAAALAISVVALVVQQRAHKSSISLALVQETRALDRAHAAELRSEQQIDAMLARISTTPRMDLSTGTVASPVDPDRPKYISDEPYMDAAWNDFRGDVDEDVPE